MFNNIKFGNKSLLISILVVVIFIYTILFSVMSMGKFELTQAQSISEDLRLLSKNLDSAVNTFKTE